MMRRNTGPLGGKYLNDAEIDSAVEEMAKRAEQDRIHVALAGGVAMQVYGSRRLTQDVDMLAEAIPVDLPDLGELSFGGIKTESAEGVPVDLIVRNDEYADLYEAALAKAEFSSAHGVYIVTPEYLAAMKWQADRTKDTDDLYHLVLRPEFDLEKTRAVFREFLGRYTAQTDLKSFVEEAHWLASRGKI